MRWTLILHGRWVSFTKKRFFFANPEKRYHYVQIFWTIPTMFGRKITQAFGEVSQWKMMPELASKSRNCKEFMLYTDGCQLFWLKHWSVTHHILCRAYKILLRGTELIIECGLCTPGLQSAWIFENNNKMIIQSSKKNLNLCGYIQMLTKCR
jgi:hypothetical protein